MYAEYLLQSSAIMNCMQKFVSLLVNYYLHLTLPELKFSRRNNEKKISCVCYEYEKNLLFTFLLVTVSQIFR